MDNDAAGRTESRFALSGNESPATRGPSSLIPVSIDYAGPGKPRNRRRNLLIVIAALLAAFPLFNVYGVVRQTLFSNRDTARAELSTIEGALDLYMQDNGRYPTTTEGLAALLVRPPGVSEWHGPYLNHKLGNDPWGHPYVYRSPGIANPNRFDLYCTDSRGRKITNFGYQ